MALDLSDFDDRAANAVKLFWGNRHTAMESQAALGHRDAGTRGAVTAGKNMDGFRDLMVAIAEANGLLNFEICLEQRVLTLPGYFRPTKLWDLLILKSGALVAAIEFKSQVGSFGNNFNNRAEEAIGMGHDVWTAYREQAFGKNASPPFFGWMMLLQDCAKSRRPVTDREPHFPVFSEWKGKSYAERYDLLCRKLVLERLYSSTALVLSPEEAKESGTYKSLDNSTSLRQFVTTFAAHIAAVAA